MNCVVNASNLDFRKGTLILSMTVLVFSHHNETCVATTTFALFFSQLTLFLKSMFCIRLAEIYDKISIGGSVSLSIEKI